MATSKTATGTKKPAAPRKSKPTAKWVRNTRNCSVHLRLRDSNDQRYFVQLEARGRMGDAHRVPAALMEDHTLVQAITHGLVEVITQTEANKIEYFGVGYQGQNGVEITRPDDRTVVTNADWDGKGRSPQRQIITQDNVTRSVQSGQTPSMDGVAGANAQMKLVGEDRRPTAEDMIPAGIDLKSRAVKVERVRG